jgi:hypothetical protein
LSHPCPHSRVLPARATGMSSGLDFCHEPVHGCRLADEKPPAPDVIPAEVGSRVRATVPGRGREGSSFMSRELPPDTPESELPRVPGFRTWRGVYFFVFGAFLLLVIALALFSRAFA